MGTDIKKFKKELGDIYPLVERIWNEICQQGFCVEPHKILGPKELPVAKCTELEKILLTCITYMEDGQEKVAIMQYLILLIGKNHKVEHGAKVEVRKSYLIVIVG